MKISSRIAKAVVILEAILASLLAIGVIIGSTDILRYFKIIYHTTPMETFPVLQTFLGHILTLVIGLELAVMLIRHTPSSVIEVLLYAIARKIIIEPKNMFDVVLGILALGGLLFINKHFNLDPARTFITDINIVNPATLVSDLNKKLKVNIPEDLGNTIGGVVAKVCRENGEKPTEGKILKIADAEITILAMDGELIRELEVVKCDEKDVQNYEV